MDEITLLGRINTMIVELKHRQSLLPILVKEAALKVPLERRCATILLELDTLRRRFASNGHAGRRDLQLPQGLCERHRSLMAEMREVIFTSTRLMLNHRGYMKERRLTAADADTGYTCMKCSGLLVAGELAGILTRCAHHFHSRCVVQWLEVQAVCPFCELPI